MLVFLGLLTLLLQILNFAFNQWLLNEEPRNISDTKGKNKYRWGWAIYFVMIGYNVIFVIDLHDDRTVAWFIVFILIIGLGYRTWMEWIYLQGSREYVVSFLMLASSILAVLLYVFIEHQIIHTTAQEVVFDELYEEEIAHISVRDDTNHDDSQEIIIEDRAMIEAVIDDFAHVELRREYDLLPVQTIHETYRLTIDAGINNHVDIRIYEEETESYMRLSPARGMGWYEILSEHSYLDTLENEVLDY